MKITEIKWEQGKKYKAFGIVWDVHNMNLFCDGGSKKITKCFTLEQIVEEDFEEVIEPVDFLTAYNDCLENGTEYKNVEFDQKMSIDICNCVSIEQHEGEASIAILNTIEWKKVSK